MLFPATVYAAQTATQPNMFAQFVPFILVFFVFYFLIIRPQQKKNKTHKRMLEQLKKGDQIITTGGILGMVERTYDNQDYVQIEIADKVLIKIQKPCIATVTDTTKNNK